MNVLVAKVIGTVLLVGCLWGLPEIHEWLGGFKRSGQLVNQLDDVSH